MSERPTARTTPSTSLDYLLIGHVVVDRVDARHVVLGGTASYAAVTLRNLGIHGALHTSASYEPGLVDTLYGTQIARIPADYTTCFANTQENGTRRQVIESVAAKLTFEQLLPGWRHPKVVHLAPVCQEMEAGHFLDRFPRSFLGVTPQGWLRAWDEETGEVRFADWPDAERALKRADAVVISENDVPDQHVVDAWAAHARLLVVTRGPQGCDVYEQGESAPHHVPAFRAGKEVDSTGAGDVFATAFFWHLSQTRNWQEAADWAACVASFVGEKRGVAGVPKLEEVEKRWREGARLVQTRKA